MEEFGTARLTDTIGSGATIANAMPESDSTVTDASVATSSGGGAFLDLRQPSPADPIGGAFVLAIAGASFAARRVGTARTV